MVDPTNIKLLLVSTYPAMPAQKCDEDMKQPLCVHFQFLKFPTMKARKPLTSSNDLTVKPFHGVFSTTHVQCQFISTESPEF